MAFARFFAAIELWGVTMAGAYHEKLLAHEFGDHLPVHTLRIGPLDNVVRYFDCEFHRR